MTTVRPWLISFAAAAFLALAGSADAAEMPETVQFNRDIRPILSNNCFTCHGPDHAQRKADLRLDRADDPLLPHKSGTPIVAGHAQRSELFARVSSTDPDEQMPPPKNGKKLSAAQI